MSAYIATTAAASEPHGASAPDNGVFKLTFVFDLTVPGAEVALNAFRDAHKNIPGICIAGSWFYGEYEERGWGVNEPRGLGPDEVLWRRVFVTVRLGQRQALRIAPGVRLLSSKLEEVR